MASIVRAPRPWLRPRGLAGIAALACIWSAVSAGSALAGGLHWSAPVRLANTYGVTAISCPSARLCVAGTADEGLLVSTEPAGGAGAWLPSAVPPSRPGFGGVQGVACPSASFCVAVSSNAILSSTDPAGGASAWKVAVIPIPSDEYLDGVACASPSLCVAFAASTHLYSPGVAPHGGRVLGSTDPGGGASAWKAVVLHDVADSVYCLPSVCVLGTEDGDILTARHPTRGARAWQSVHEIGARGAPAYIPVVACASTHYCLAPIGGILRHGELLTRDLFDHKPFGWAYLQGFGGAASPAPLSGSCLSGGFCAFGATVGSGTHRGYGEILTSAGPRKRWATTRIAASETVAVSCASQSFCVAGGTNQPIPNCPPGPSCASPSPSGLVVIGEG
ncbi:MAG: hypothetical protein ACRDL5_01360 [Solirubrobacteraceae bacterium]